MQNLYNHKLRGYGEKSVAFMATMFLPLHESLFDVLNVVLDCKGISS